MTHRVLNKHKAKSIIQIYSDVMKTIQCAHPSHHNNGFVATCRPSIAGMSPQSHCGDEEMGALDCLHDVTIYLYLYMKI